MYSVVLRNVINYILLLELCSEHEHIKGWRGNVAKKLFLLPNSSESLTFGLPVKKSECNSV